MLPPGHIAAGYLLLKSIIYISQPLLSTTERSWLAALGGFFAFAPDLDMFYAFIKEHGFHHTGEKFTHREFITHTPIFWLVISIITALIGHSLFWNYFALAILVGSWSHLALDSTFFGIRWLYPFSKKFYALKMAGQVKPNMTKGFFNHWLTLVKEYYGKHPLTFWADIALVITALIVIFL